MVAVRMSASREKKTELKVLWIAELRLYIVVVIVVVRMSGSEKDYQQKNTWPN